MSDAPIMTDTNAVYSIQQLLSGVEWDSEMLETVAQFIRLTGRDVLDPDDPKVRHVAMDPVDMTQPKVDVPVQNRQWIHDNQISAVAFDHGYKHGLISGDNYKTGWNEGLKHGLAQCNHHPEAMTIPDFDDALTTAIGKAFEEGKAVGQADCNGLKSTRISDLERHVTRLEFVGKQQEVRVADLVRLNGNQSEIIDQGTFDEGNEAGYADGLAQGRREMALQLQGNKEDYADGLAAGLQRGEKTAHQKYDEGHTVGHKTGFEEGRKYGLQDWMMHFILYLQENDQDFAVVKLSQLNEMREATLKIRQIVDFSEALDPMLEEIETVLTRLETIDR